MSGIEHDALVQQIGDLLDGLAEMVGLLGLDLAGQAAARVQGRADLYAAQLESPDRRLAAQTAIDLAQLLPDQIPAEFWASPLGIAIGRTYEVPATVSVTEAARTLGVSHQRVSTLLRDGKLTRAASGVELASVLLRIQERGAPTRTRAEADAHLAAERASWDERDAQLEATRQSRT